MSNTLIEPERQPAGTEFYSGADRPDGEWRALSGSAPLMRNRFATGQVASFRKTGRPRTGLASVWRWPPNGDY